MQFDKQRKILIAWALVPCLLLVSCATFVAGTSETVLFSSNPQGADVVVVEKNTTNPDVFFGRTPFSVRLAKSSTWRVEMSWPTGGEFGDAILRLDVPRHFEGWFVGNLLYAPVIGMIVDLLTGASSDFDPQVYVDFANGDPIVVARPTYIPKLGWADLERATPFELVSFAWAIGIEPSSSPEDRALALVAARRAVESSTILGYRYTIGLVLYRSGLHEEALEQAEQCKARNERENRYDSALDLLLMAMIKKELGEREEAGRLLALVETRTDLKEGALKLLREAKELIRVESPPADDPGDPERGNESK